MALPSDIKPRNGVLHHELGNETIVLNTVTERYYSLGGVGGRLWTLFSAGCTIEQAIATLVAEYDVDRATAERDLQAFVDILVAAKLVDTAA